MRECDDRIRRPVAVVTAVERARRTVDGHLDVGDAARAEVELHVAALVHRAVAQQPAVGVELTIVIFDIALEVRRARFLFALEHEPQIDGRLRLDRVQRVERGEHGDDRRLVVARRAPVQPRLRPAAAQHRFPRRRRPLRGIDWLAVVVRVKRECGTGS